ncbi:nucleoside-triphosphatase [Marchantia polymorpha subsp. ruderalis]
MEAAAGMASKRLVFVTGPPGVGKTTLIMKVLERLRREYPNLHMRGFYTRETRDSAGQRVGFEAVTVDGRSASLASIFPFSSSSSAAGTRAAAAKVGKYNVDVRSFESLVLPELQEIAQREDVGDSSSSSSSSSNRLFVIDEVGKMELFSSSFFPAVCDILNSASASSSSSTLVLGTIPVPKFGKDLVQVARIRTRSDVAIFSLTKANRDAMAISIFSHIVSLMTH